MNGLEETSFRDIVGQEAACGILASALRSNRVPHAYLFIGPAGVGKRTAARQWAKTMECLSPRSPADACETCASCQKVAAGQHPDVLWVDFAYQARLLGEPEEKQKSLKIDTIREMEHSLRLKAFEGRSKVAFLVPAEELVEAAAHALLKILEEPPPATHIVLITSDAGRILGTLRSRCQWVRFRPLPSPVLADYLVQRAERGEGFSAEEARAAARVAEGSISRALEILEGGEELSFDWENAPLSEVLSWCEGFHNPRLGRPAAEKFLRRLLGRFQGEMQEGRRDPAAVERTLDALRRLRQNVSPQLTLETLLLRFRRESRRRTAV